MAKYTIAGVVYKHDSTMVTVDLSTDHYGTYDAWKHDCFAYTAYRLVCTAQEGKLLMQKEFTKNV